MRTTYQYINGTHTFYELRLAATPTEMVEAAQKTAGEDIARAYSALMQLGYTDTGYGALQELYSQAVAEFHEGREALNEASLASGNEALSRLAEAATTFTRAQAHAKQVYEALVSPPTGPSDLGLEPFGGNWASWETRVGRKN